NDVAILTEEKVEQLYLQLRRSSLSAGVKKKRWSFLKRFIRYLWEKRLLELPRNLESHSFQVRPQAIQTYSPAQLTEALDALKPRLRLYCILGLNCGMTAADIGQLKKDQIDLDAGTLRRKRVKTSDNVNVPTVSYNLWPEVIKLLKQCWSDHPTLALT